jgi:uncharacterized membrane protein
MTTALPTPPAGAPSAPTSSAPAPHAAPARPPRLDSVDLLRGLVMVIMVLDHTRDFAFAGTLHFGATDLTQTTPAIFFTRWITHFCAPIFVFLAGTGIMLQRLRGKPLPELSRFLVTRGLWLIVLEFTAVRIGWLWNLDYDRFIGMAQVIWAIGWGMIIMAALIRLPVAAVFTLGLAITFLHDLLTPFFGPFMTPPGAPAPTLGADLFMILFSRGVINLGHPTPVIFFGYAVIPWLGAMALGYGVGVVYGWTPAARQRALLWAGSLTTLAFVVVRAINHYGDPAPWSTQPTAVFTLLSFLNVNKYPPSLDYLLMTLGPAMLALVWFERLRPNALSQVFVTFGRVPFFFYLLQWPFAHGLALIAGLVAHKPVDYLSTSLFSGTSAPPNAGVSLPATYALWLAAIVLLYPLCRWYANLKRTHTWWWLSYI